MFFALWLVVIFTVIMAKEILLYNSIYSFSAEYFINQLEEVAASDVIIRLNTDGGDPQDGWGMIAKLQERKSNTLLKVDGKAHSWGAFLCCCVAEVEALDASTFAFHRAAYGWMETQPDFKGSPQETLLVEVNKKLRKLLTSKIDVAEFEKIAKVTIDELFSMDARVTVVLNAAQAEKVKLISKITKITAEKRKEISSNWEKIASEMSGLKMAAKVDDPKPENQNPTYMTLAEFKAQHPAIYAQAVAEGVKDGITTGIAQEVDRVGACMVFNDVDPEGVKAAIASGKPLTSTQMAEFSRKAMAKGLLGEVKKDANGNVITEQPNPAALKTEKEKAVASFEADVQASLKKANPSQVAQASAAAAPAK